jgi:hypothetical protein
MAKKPSPLANMMAQAAAPAGIPFKQGVATPPPKAHTMTKASGHTMPPTKTAPPSKPGGGRGNMANFRGKHAPPFTKKS